MPHATGHLQSWWWKEGTVYQVYPASFKDSNDDGIGDIPGMVSKPNDIKYLGIDIIWFSPHFKSPQVDMGYDTSDVEDIHEQYGTLTDCERLIAETHKRGMKVIFDLVINHTSAQHAWFKESRSSRNNSKRDWYFWRQPRIDKDDDRCRPNNWRSQFTEPAWTWDPVTEEYYLHVYASGQPDLNFENKECRQAVYNSAIRFWLDRGVDGFRIDTVNKYSKVPGLLDAPISEPAEETQVATSLYTNGPRIHEYLEEIKDIMSEYGAMTIGELPSTPERREVFRYISTDSGELDMVFNFDTVTLGRAVENRLLPKPFDNNDFKRELTKWQNLPYEGAWTTVFLENHDQGRSISRFASDLPEYRENAAKMLATVLGTMTGTLFLYQGQEIGMTNAPVTWSEHEYKCVRSTNYFNDVCKRNGDRDLALRNLARLARDHARVPMQWDSTTNAGFSSESAKPWMSVLENHKQINVADQLERQDSVLQYWRTILSLRKQHADLFVHGRFILAEQQKDLMIFLKVDDHTGAAALTVANLSHRSIEFEGPDNFHLEKACLALSLYDRVLNQQTELEPYEARVYIAGVQNGA